MAYQGMDVDGVERSADDLTRLAAQLSTLTVQIGSTVSRARTGWLGSDAAAFVGVRWPVHRTRLLESHAALTAMAATLRSNASDQRQASAAGVSAAGAGAAVGGALRALANALGSEVPAELRSGDPAEVAQYWSSLSEAEQRALIAAHPDVIGMTDGIPGWARNDANQTLLERDIKELSSKQWYEMTPAELYRLDTALKIQDALEDAEKAADGAPVQLLLYRPDTFGMDGSVAISIGDVDTAKNVSTFVPGMMNRASNAEGGVEYAANFRDAALAANGGASTASVFWLDYDAPSTTWNKMFDAAGVVSPNAANDGGQRLAAFQAGLQATHIGDAHWSVVGHSYGSTTVSYAAAQYGMKVDDIVLIGSPGAGPAKTAADLGGANVYVGSASRDFVTGINELVDGVEGSAIPGAGIWGGAITESTPSPLGFDPAEDNFGAVRFQAESPDRLLVPNLDDHNRYQVAGSESATNVGRIIGGNGDSVTTAAPRADVLGFEVDPETFPTASGTPPMPSPSPGPAPTPPPP